MIDGVIVLIAGVAYLFGFYKISFWVIIAAMLNGVLGSARAILDPTWYRAMAAAAGVQPNYTMLIATKAIILAVLAWAAWFAGGAAGYF